MAKLPENFVKRPAAASSRRGARSAQSTPRDRRSKLALEKHGAGDPDEILVRLSREELEALQAACAALGAIGQEVTVEEMIKQVVGRWIAATRAACAVDRPVIAELPEPAHQSILSHLREIAEQPVRRWRELSVAMRRLSRAIVGLPA